MHHAFIFFDSPWIGFPWRHGHKSTQNVCSRVNHPANIHINFSSKVPIQQQPEATLQHKHSRSNSPQRERLLHSKLHLKYDMQNFMIHSIIPIHVVLHFRHSHSLIHCRCNGNDWMHSESVGQRFCPIRHFHHQPEKGEIEIELNYIWIHFQITLSLFLFSFSSSSISSVLFLLQFDSWPANANYCVSFSISLMVKPPPPLP